MLPFDKIEEVFGPDGLLSQSLPSFELRQGQLRMAKSIHATLSGASENPEIWEQDSSISSILAVEAETGIGKTLAYLVPAVLSGQKVVVSTGTINLQDQILNKEIPFIKKHIFPELNALCVKGRENYLCLFRTKQFLSTPQLHLFEDNQELNLLKEWLAHTETGDRAELSWLPDYSELWRQFSSTTRKCQGNSCPEWQSCFINRLRRKAAKAQVLIVNHHLFFSDLGLRRFGHAEVLPRYESVIFDEAHHIENVATRYFGTSFSHLQLLDLAHDIEEISKDKSHKSNPKTIQTARRIASQAEVFAAIFPKELGRFPLSEMIEKIPVWDDQLHDLIESIAALERHLAEIAVKNDVWDSPLKRCQELKTSLQTVTMDQNPATVYWAERRPKSISLSASPIDIAPDLQENLYGQCRSIVFTSATLTTSRNFNYFFERLGLEQETESLTLTSPFDYKSRTRLYIPPTGFPEPNATTYQEEIERHFLEIVLATHGRALLLFTSLRAMRQMRSFLDEHISIPIFMQGDAPKSALLDDFQQQTESVLLAVASFWEGVDVPGESLSCVIIDKLPFEVPSDPVIMARINKIRQEGGNPFFDFQVPRAILTLRQGLGRLMRAAGDHGIMAIMDIRLFSKGYGKTFRKSLPNSPVIRTINEIEEFTIT